MYANLSMILLSAIPLTHGDNTVDLRRFLSKYRAGRIDAAKVQKLIKSLEPDPLFPALERALAKVSDRPTTSAFDAILEIAAFRFHADDQVELKRFASRQPWVVRRRAIDELRELYINAPMQIHAIERLRTPGIDVVRQRVLMEVLAAAAARKPIDLTRRVLRESLDDKDAEIRGLAAQGIPGFDVADDLLRLARLYFDRDARVRLRAVMATRRSLERLGEELAPPLRRRAVELLATRLRDSDPHVRFHAAEGVEAHGFYALVGALVDALEDEEKRAGTEEARLRFQVAVENALHRLTGRGNPPLKSAEWRAWLARVTAPKTSDDGSRLATRSTTPPIERKYAKYFGREVRSNHVVFIMDFSGSMRRKAGSTRHDMGEGPRRPETRIELAKREFSRFLKAIDERHFFNVVVFAVGSRAAFQDLVPATKQNKTRAKSFLGRLLLGGSTDLFAGILKGLHVGGLDAKERFATSADTVYLLSDGIPTTGAVTHPADIVRIISRINDGSGLTLNVVDLGARHSAFQKHLRALALQNGGDYIRPD